ncbi:MAG: hypothetical protein IKC64_01525 [Clostridia bacterium]|nr:hypothetical protein [Clostridia bacterium]
MKLFVLVLPLGNNVASQDSTTGISHCVRNDSVALVVVGGQALLASYRACRGIPLLYRSTKGISHCVRNDKVDVRNDSVALVVIGNQALLVVVVGNQTVFAGGGKPLPYGYTVIYPYSQGWWFIPTRATKLHFQILHYEKSAPLWYAFFMTISLKCLF